MQLKEIADEYGKNFINVVEIELRKLAAEQPEFRYRIIPTAPSDGSAVSDHSFNCSYNSGCSDNRDKPLGPECSGCIFGQALKRLGWDDPEELDSDEDIEDLLLTHTALNECPFAWFEVQAVQDKGGTWAEAIAKLNKDTKREAV